MKIAECSFDVTVMICTRDPRTEYLKLVLAALERQTLPRHRWELFLIDNASRTRLDEVSTVSWHPNARVERVDRVGKIHAVVGGVRLSRGEVLVVVDDDNVLADDYLERVVEFFASHPFAGVVNGVVTGEFETEPPPVVKRHLLHIGVRDLGRRVMFSLMPGLSGFNCYGAGMGVRRAVAEHYLAEIERDPRRLAITTRSDDTDMALCAFEVGLAQAYCPDLHLQHLIPANRVTLHYLEGIVEQNSYGTRMIQLLRGLEEPERPRPFVHRWMQPLAQVTKVAARIAVGAQTYDEYRLIRARTAGRRRAEHDYRQLNGAREG